jgi:hypothetical protein
MFRFLDIFFIVFRTLLIFFNLFGWIIKPLRRANLITSLPKLIRQSQPE